MAGRLPVRLACPSLLMLLAVVAATSAQQVPPVDLYLFGYDARKDFIAFDPNYPATHDALSSELDALQADMIRQQRSGRNTYCSPGVFGVPLARVLHVSLRTGTRAIDVAKCWRRNPIPTAASNPNRMGASPHAARLGGSEWISVATNSLVLAQRWEEPKYPLKLLESINSPEKLRRHLDSVLISDIRKTGLKYSRAKHGHCGFGAVYTLGRNLEGTAHQVQL